MTDLSVVVPSRTRRDFDAFVRVNRSHLGAVDVVPVLGAASMNAALLEGASRASTSKLALCHDDVEVLSDGFWARISLALDSLDVVGLAGTTDLRDGRWNRTGTVGACANPEHEDPDGPWQVSFFGRPGEIVPVQALDGFVLGMRRAVLPAVPPDPTLDGWHFYDVDLSFRAHLAGLRVAVIPGMAAIHRGNQALSGDDWGRHRTRFEAKHGMTPIPSEDSSPRVVVRVATREDAVRVMELLDPSVCSRIASAFEAPCALPSGRARMEARTQVPEASKITAAMVTHNSADTLADVLSAIPDRVPVVVVDNASADGTLGILNRWRADRQRRGSDNVLVIENAENLYYGPATNQAIERVATPLVAGLCPNHVALHKGWDEALESFMDENPDADLAGDAWNPYDFGCLDDLPFPLPSRLYREGWHPEKKDLVHVQGGAWVARRSLFREIGGFSAEYHHDYSDCELSFRALSFGKGVVHCPAISSPPAPEQIKVVPVQHHRHARKPGVVKLDLACGENCTYGFDGVDVSPLSGVKYVHNLFDYPWPFKDDSVTEIVAVHFIEHVPMLFWHPEAVGPTYAGLEWTSHLAPIQVDDRSVELFLKFLDEVYRVLKPGGIARFSCPQAHNDRAFQDPSHRRFIVPGTFNYGDPEYRRQNGLGHAAYGVRCNFPMLDESSPSKTKIQHTFSDAHANLIRILTQTAEGTKAFRARVEGEWNFALDMVIELKKPPLPRTAVQATATPEVQTATA